MYKLAMFLCTATTHITTKYVPKTNMLFKCQINVICANYFMCRYETNISVYIPHMNYNTFHIQANTTLVHKPGHLNTNSQTVCVVSALNSWNYCSGQHAQTAQHICKIILLAYACHLSYVSYCTNTLVYLQTLITAHPSQKSNKLQLLFAMI